MSGHRGRHDYGTLSDHIYMVNGRPCEPAATIGPTEEAPRPSPASPGSSPLVVTCKDDLMTKLTGQQIADERLDGWAYLLGGLQTRIHTKNFATGLAVVNAIGAAAEEMNHHPDLTLRYTHIDVRVTSHDGRAVTHRDVRLGRAISAIAAAAGVRLDSSGVSRLERIDAALAAGGTLVSYAEAPSFWVLAGPQGNRACLCTWQDRG
jgi:pterin-4a-carbinolamine dehydratase